MASGPFFDVSGFDALTARGIKGRIGDEDYFLGNHRLMHELGTCDPQLEARLEAYEKEGQTAVVLCTARSPLLVLAVADNSLQFPSLVRFEGGIHINYGCPNAAISPRARPSGEIAFGLNYVLIHPDQFPPVFHHWNHFSGHFRIHPANHLARHSNSRDRPHPSRRR